jgi:hypothetical protein
MSSKLVFSERRQAVNDFFEVFAKLFLESCVLRANLENTKNFKENIINNDKVDINSKSPVWVEVVQDIEFFANTEFRAQLQLLHQ